MNWRKIGKGILFPHWILLILLLPAGTVFLVYSMLRLGDRDPVRIASYVLAFYTLTVWCVRIPELIGRFRHIRKNNPYIQRWVSDPRLRVNVSLTINVLWNGAYAAMQLGLGIYHRSLWYDSLTAYYASLAIMRLYLVRHTRRHDPGENLRQELIRYRGCGWIFLFMNLALSGMMFYMIREERVMHHHEITTIAMAAYTFTTLTVAIVNVVRYRKYKSPAFSASKAISLASACVSMLTLENTMLATFSGDEMLPRSRTLFLGLSGGAISIMIIIMAVYMIVQSNKKMKLIMET